MSQSSNITPQRRFEALCAIHGGPEKTAKFVANLKANVDQIAAVAGIHRTRKPSLAKLVKQAERGGRKVSSVTTESGVTIRFAEEPADETNPWLVTK
jgi:hypothetical protein